MNETWLSVFIVALFLLRPWWLWQLWRAPLKRGEEQFLGIKVEPEFYRNTGAAILRRFRLWALVPLGLEMMLLLALMLSGRWVYALYEQLPAVVLLTLWFNFTAVQFMTRVRLLTSDAPAPVVTGVQLSLAPRRLRDYSDWRVEAVLGGLTLLALLWLLAQWLDIFPPHPRAEVFGTVVLLLYLQAGALLLKQLFVRWRMKFPLNRVEDYRRWRAAWLTYHLHVFDALRLLLAFALWGLLAFKTFKRWWGVERVHLVWLTVALTAIVVYVFYCVREWRRLAVVEREIRPVELLKEYPPTPVAEGRFLAGGLLYLNRDNPVILARSPQGLAINLAHRGTYILVAYLTGLILLVLWQVGH
jgi:hypothetical protein